MRSVRIFYRLNDSCQHVKKFARGLKAKTTGDRRRRSDTACSSNGNFFSGSRRTNVRPIIITYVIVIVDLARCKRK